MRREEPQRNAREENAENVRTHPIEIHGRVNTVGGLKYMSFDHEELTRRAYDEELERLEAERLMEEARERARRDFERMRRERRNDA